MASLKVTRSAESAPRHHTHPMTSPVSRTVFLLVLAAASAACGSSSSTGFSGTGGVDGEAGEGNASGGKAGGGGSDGKGGKGGSAGRAVAPAKAARRRSAARRRRSHGRSGSVVQRRDRERLETDVDCGGPDCQPCATGQTCDEASDCKSEVCDPDTTLCLKATCGDGAVDDGEECDDGESNSDTEANACRTACKLATCGDGVLDGEEECDDGEQNSDTAADACRTSCTLPACGDDVVDEVKPAMTATRRTTSPAPRIVRLPAEEPWGPATTRSRVTARRTARRCSPSTAIRFRAYLAAPSGLCEGTCAERNLGPDAVGCDFRATDLRQHGGYTGQAMRLVLTNATSSDASVTVTQGAGDVATFTVPANSRYQQALGPVSALRAGNTVLAADSAFRVRSTEPLSAFQHVIPEARRVTRQRSCRSGTGAPITWSPRRLAPTPLPS